MKIYAIIMNNYSFWRGAQTEGQRQSEWKVGKNGIRAILNGQNRISILSEMNNDACEK